MNCRECQELLQRRLDGEAAANVGVAEHLDSCSECAAMFAAARCLEKGLRLFAAPTPSPGFAGRTAALVLAQRRARLRLRWRWTAAAVVAAASVLLTVWFFANTTPGQRADGPVARDLSKEKTPQPVVKGTVAPTPDPVEHARGVLDQWLERLWAMAREQTDWWRDLLVPLEVAGLDLNPKPSPAQPKVDPPRPGMTVGLKTVAAVTKRGLSFMFNETPALQPELPKTNGSPPLEKKHPEGAGKAIKDS